MTTLKIGVVGYSAQKFSDFDAMHLLGVAFDRVLVDYPGATAFTIVSGLTDLGIPKLAYRAAMARGWRTSGIACAEAEKYDCFDVDEKKIVGDNWGDESKTFLDEIDVLVRIGGGKQSLAEVARFKANGGHVYEFELEALPA